MSQVLGVSDQDKFDNLDESSKYVVDQTTGLAQKLGSDGKGTGEAKPLAELMENVPADPDPKPKARNFSAQAKKDQNLDGHGDPK